MITKEGKLGYDIQTFLLFLCAPIVTRSHDSLGVEEVRPLSFRIS